MKRSIFLLIVLISLLINAVELGVVLDAELRGDMHNAVDKWMGFYEANKGNKLAEYVSLNRIYDISNLYGCRQKEVEDLYNGITGCNFAKYFLFFTRYARGMADHDILNDLNVMKGYYILGPFEYDEFDSLGKIERYDEKSYVGKNTSISEFYVHTPFIKIYPATVLEENRFSQVRLRNNLYVEKDGNYEIEFSFSNAFMIMINDKVIYRDNVYNTQGISVKRLNIFLSAGHHSIVIFSGIEDEAWDIQIFYDKDIRFLKDEELKGIKKGGVGSFSVSDIFEEFDPVSKDDEILYAIALRYAKNFSRGLESDHKAIVGVLQKGGFDWGFYFAAELSEDANESLRWLKMIDDRYSDQRNYFIARLFYFERNDHLAYVNLKNTKIWRYHNSSLMLGLLNTLGFTAEYTNFMNSIRNSQFYGKMLENIYSDLERMRNEDIPNYYEECIKSNPYNFLSITFAFIKYIKDMGLEKMIKSLYGKILELNIFNKSTVIDHLEYLQKINDDDLIAQLSRYRKIYPYNKEMMRMGFEHYLRSNNAKKVIEIADEILKYYPQEQTVIDILAELTERKNIVNELFDDSYDIKKEVILSETEKESDVIILHEKDIVEIKENDNMVRYYEGVYYINKYSGIDKMAYYPIYFISSTEYVKIDELYVHTPEGYVFPITDHFVQPVQSYQNIFSDLKRYLIRMSNLKIGAKVYIKYRVIQYSRSSYKDRFPGHINFITREYPIKKKTCYVVYPDKKRFNEMIYRIDNKPRIYKKDGYSIIERTFENIRQIPSYPFIAPYTEIAPYTVLTNFQSWNDIYRWIYVLFEERLRPSETVLNEYEKIGIKKEMGFEQRVSKIFDYVAREIHYLGIEYGLNGYQPRFPSKVIREKYGDCKDKSTLMKVFLDLAGIKSNITLVRTANAGNMETLPIITAFNHAILTVYNERGIPYIVDPTVEYGLPFELPQGLETSFAMEIEKGGFRLKTITRNPGAENITRVNNKVMVHDNMTAIVERSVKQSGNNNIGSRYLLSNSDIAYERFSSYWTRNFTRSTIKDLEIGDLYTEQVAYSYSIIIEDYVNPETMKFKFIDNDEGLMDYVTLDNIRYPLYIEYARDTDINTEYVLSADYEYLEIPSSIRFDNKIFYGRINFEKAENILKCNYTVKFRKRTVNPSEYASFKKDITAIYEVWKKEVVIGKK